MYAFNKCDTYDDGDDDDDEFILIHRSIKTIPWQYKLNKIKIITTMSSRENVETT